MKKTQRPNYRYIIFEVIGEEPANLESFLYKEFMKFFGEFGLSKIGFKLIEYNERIGIVRCSRDYMLKVIGFLALIKKPRIKTLKSSGTVKTLRDFRVGLK